ncbi:bifunctional [glutamate--ammonia ligase]-adenylyl-L-tyrosine phosphorylase/[glutamate--ammonia-ligase] adenylyltransferase [Sphingomicrobium lutaoense]|uniref:Glutamate-ammonia-ligase adenylyltransferase n=1 Tax=Sphingomicrobium lutaoense TaxID=515949 RepID=A0A839YVT5_9SPHN|nr:bifunctional [glutamate--ammonia ligase]-adenylyl-L-tyrosine phosphorylase/[glutamate--ammonia-ligase] adenylyltransferase [Sphingomicrobium lutaoense]MBB3764331.1 glutamate-ammonia-ligase adenylyltransferase [Sphingomicrobium lutaoense]
MNRSERLHALERARENAPFLRGAASRWPECVDLFVEQGPDVALAGFEIDGNLPLSAQLRRRRDALALVTALADLSGDWTLEQVTRSLSDFADGAIDRALGAAIDERVPGAPLLGFSVIALGKLGSRELNYSSDIDLILLYDPDHLPRREKDDAGESAVRIARRFVQLLQERDADGYVARVDLRLRPASEVTPIALPVNAAISHYESQALGWERAAFIRARAAGGDMALGQRFLESIQPFIWRRAIDYGVIEEIRRVGQRIRDHYAGGQNFGPGYDLKRGRGGIREVEFFLQAQQLIHGGRDPSLRQPATLDAAAALRLAGHLDGHGAEVLSNAYRALRSAEHRVQMIGDKQTHELPKREEALDAVARLDGCGDGKAFIESLRPHVHEIAQRFDRIVADGPAHLPANPERLAEALKRYGLDDPEAAVRLIGNWRSGRVRSLRSGPARAAFEAMLPTMVEAIAAAPDPVHALNRFADIVEGIPSGINFYRLIEARPELARLLARILSHAPALAQQLGRRPSLLDGLLDRSTFDPLPDAESFAETLEEETAPLEYDLALDRARALVGEKRFALGVQLIDGKADPLEIAAGYSRVAEGAIQALAARTIREFEIQHGRFDNDGLVILGLGRLGGETLTFASDLDIIFLFDAPTGEASNGARPLGPSDYYNRLASRIISALSVPTAAGPLYEVDTRLRPQGVKGSLATSIHAFHAYQLREAWTWEHMALTRARPVFGSAAAQQKACEVLADIFGAERDPAKTIADAAAMREEMAQHKPPRGKLDLKLGPGGLVDGEFAIHTRQLISREGLDPDLEVVINALHARELAPDSLLDDMKLLTGMLVILRLVAPDTRGPSRSARELLAELTGYPDWKALMAAHDAARSRIADYWKQVKEDR